MEYSRHQVAHHNTRDSAWIIYESRVYDVTNFLNLHPAGESLILSQAGKDITKVMSETHTHSDHAFTMLDNFEIGRLEGAPNTRKAESVMNHRSVLRKEVGVNLKEPILLQMLNMPGEKYQEWVHLPIVPSETNHLYLFEKKQYGVLEINTQTKWYIIPLFWIPMALYCLYQCTTSHQSILFGLLMGMVIWSFTEYFLHGFLFHADTTSWWANILHFSFHGIHHLNPLDQNRLVFPPTIGLIFIALPLHLLALRLFPLWLMWPIEAGFLIGYVSYDLTHYYLHHGTWVFGPLKYLKRCHMHHHFFTEGEKYNFGVSLLAKPLDFLFGTNKVGL